MLATAIMSGLGFVFWLLVARLFSTEEVGLAATLLSVMSMTSALSLAGFDTTIIRFLAHDERRNEVLNTSIILVGFIALILSSLFVLTVHFTSPSLSFLQATPGAAFAFVCFSVMAAINILTDAVFLAFRQTKYSFLIDSTFSMIKVMLPLAFIGWGAFGIFAAAAVAQSIGFVLSITVLIRTFEYRPRFIIDRTVLTRVWRYSAGNYLSDIFNFLPSALLPLIIVNNLGAHESAYFYVITMIVGLLYVIPSAVTRSLFAEGSYDERNIPRHLTNALRTIAAFLIPAMIVLFFGGQHLLALFGKDYSSEGMLFLRIMTLVSILITVSMLFAALFRLTHNVRGLIWRNLSYAVSIIGSTYLLLPYGLAGVGIAYAIANGIATLVSAFLYLRSRRAQLTTPTSLIGFFRHILTQVMIRSNEEVFSPIAAAVAAKTYAVQARRMRAHTPTILFYPELPKTYHVLYKVCHRLGYRITNNPKTHADIVINFEDTTYRTLDPVLEELRKTRRIINIDSTDISKQHVEEVFEEVFGYGMKIDPQVFTGTCVQKSNTNAVHDGKVITCPAEPKEGYIYQRLIEPECKPGETMDLRIFIFNDQIPFILKRYKDVKDRFNLTTRVERVDTTEVLSVEEIERTITFSRKMGLDYGEIDALRCSKDGKLYIVDVNNTPAGPLSIIGKDRPEYIRWIQTLCTVFASEFERPPYFTPKHTDAVYP
jgi:O-antigen/teichoic acid export membrane protein